MNRRDRRRLARQLRGGDPPLLVAARDAVDKMSEPDGTPAERAAFEQASAHVRTVLKGHGVDLDDPVQVDTVLAAVAAFNYLARDIGISFPGGFGYVLQVVKDARARGVRL